MNVIEEARALLIGAGARAFFSARDLSTSRALPAEVRAAWRALQAASCGAHRPRFDAVLRARAAGLTAEALTWGDTPLSLAIDLLREARVTRGDVVLDPLAGRGNVLLAARALGAEAHGIELDRAHVDVAAPLLARAGAALAHEDARTSDAYEGATCVYLAWTSLDTAARDAILARIPSAPAPGSVRLIALTWEPHHPRVVIERTERRWFPWGRVDVVSARIG